MEGRTHERDRRAARAALAATLLLALLPAATLAAPPWAVAVPDCSTGDTDGPADAEVVTPWQTVLDANGVVAGHRLVLRRGGVDLTLRAGREGFSVPVSGARLLVGERSAESTSVTMLDTGRACRLWERTFDGLAFETDPATDPGELLLAIHDPATRKLLGNLVLEAEGGATVAMIDGQCNTSLPAQRRGADARRLRAGRGSAPCARLPGGGLAQGHGPALLVAGRGYAA